MEDVNLTSKVSERLFLGCPLTSELRMHLNQSILWKHQKIAADPGLKIQEVHYEGKDYLGIYLKLEKISLSDLEKQKLFLSEKIKEFCPKFSPEGLGFFVFFQVFIS